MHEGLSRLLLMSAMVRYLEEVLHYEGRLDRGDAAGRDEEDMCMSFEPAFFRSKVLHHLVPRQLEVLSEK